MFSDDRDRTGKSSGKVSDRKDQDRILRCLADLLDIIFSRGTVFPCKDCESRDILGTLIDIVLDKIQAIELRGLRTCDRSDGYIRTVRNFFRSAGCILIGDRLKSMVGDVFTALLQRLRMGDDSLNGLN